MKRTRRTHTDGSLCLEGTQRVPRRFTPCCGHFAARTLACYFDVRYEHWPRHGWLIVISPDAGGGGIRIAYCPHCGAALGKSRRSRGGRYLDVSR